MIRIHNQYDLNFVCYTLNKPSWANEKIVASALYSNKYICFFDRYEWFLRRYGSVANIFELKSSSLKYIWVKIKHSQIYLRSLSSHSALSFANIFATKPYLRKYICLVRVAACEVCAPQIYLREEAKFAKNRTYQKIKYICFSKALAQIFLRATGSIIYLL